jgi:hypothetical protein
LALPLFSLTLFISAFLLFLVQPLMGKLILPKLGGTPQVWNTCMVFFQTALLAGYAYTHTSSTRLKLRSQLAVHCLLLVAALPLFLVIPTGYWYIDRWAPDIEVAPVVATLGVLLFSIGVPFFVVSTSAPLLQKWFAYTGDPAAKDPYFLYGASNLGSLLSLVLYPFLIEPFLPVMGQRYLLVVFYVVLAVLIVACALRVWKAPAAELHLAGVGAAVADAPAPAPTPAADAVSTAVKAGPSPARAVARKKGVRGHGGHLEGGHAAPELPSISAGRPDEMTWWRRLRWTLLAAVPSSLMLGVTSYVSVDLSPFPLLWVIPLALYLTTFIVVYMAWWTGSAAGQRLELHGDAPFSPHRAVVYFLMPISILALAVILLRGGFDPFWSTLVLMLAFFFVTLGCHGELARDRPSTRHLTEYYLLMSFGGMLGGLFNGIIAPIVFPGVWEFPIAIVLAALVRPQLSEGGWLDDAALNSSPGFQTWAVQQGDQVAKSFGKPAPHTAYVFNYFMDVVLGVAVFLLACLMAWLLGDRERLTAVMKFLGLTRSVFGQYAQLALLFGLPLVIAFFFASRPLRFAIALGGVILCNQYLFNERYSGEHLRYAGRSYFGVLRVLEDEERLRGGEVNYTYLMHGTTYHGRNYIAKKGMPDLSRLATTYYHRYGPVGLVMEQYNWFPGPQNTFWADARMPCTQIGQVVASLGVGNLPVANLVDAWSEPPYATIGLGTGTMASYSRPYQSLDYYEIDEKIRNMSLPTDGSGPFFTYLLSALQRGVNLDIIMGDARLTMQKENPRNLIRPELDKGQIVLHQEPVPASRVDFYGRDGFYKAINVDAFSSDAIPVHLITKQAIKLYLSKLTDDGILCVHTSNRHLNLVKPVARVVEDLNLDARKGEGPEYLVRVGKDRDRRQDQAGPLGHFSSEYVMIFRKDNQQFLDYIAKSENKQLPNFESEVEWYDPIQKKEVSSSVWTDDYSNLVSVIRWPWSRH